MWLRGGVKRCPKIVFINPSRTAAKSGETTCRRSLPVIIATVLAVCFAVVVSGSIFPISAARTISIVPTIQEKAPAQVASNVLLTHTGSSHSETQIKDATQRLTQMLMEMKEATSLREPPSAKVEELHDDASSRQKVVRKERATRSIAHTAQVAEIQRQLALLGYFSDSANGAWSQRSREALQAFKEANSLPADSRWNGETEAVLFSGSAKPAHFAGRWAIDSESCVTFPVLLQASGASAGKTSCAFRNTSHRRGGWTISATCSDPRERWTTQVRLTLAGRKLTWSSPRGNETYIRCDPALAVASAR